MLDMIAYFENRAGVAVPALGNVAGVPDAHVTVIGDNITVPYQCNKILSVTALSGVTGVGTPTVDVVLSSPSLRATSLLECPSIQNCGIFAAATLIPGVSVVAAAAVPNPANMPPFNDFKEAPVELQAGEALQCLTSNAGAPAIEAVVVVVTLTDGILAQPFTGRIETVIADVPVGAPVPVVNVWSPLPLVSRQVLRAGTYALIGAKACSPSMVACRFVLGNQGSRPGTVANAVSAGLTTQFDSPDVCDGLFRYGRAGVWGTFTHVNPPVAEVLCSVADAVATIHVALDVIKIA